MKNEYKNEIFKILGIEVQESDCKCFTGRISRLVNCLNGFDENIKINISINEQISNVILVIKNKLENENSYSSEKHKELIKEELIKRDIDETIINEWLVYV